MLVVTVDLDWAPESAIEETLDFLKKRDIVPTVFVTHRSPRVEASLGEIEVGLHPFFDPESSHGKTIEQVVETVMAFPHTVPVFRSHRYATCNESNRAMKEAGMVVASNICTDLEIVPPFIDRLGLIQVPIYFEDGGYLWNRHPLSASFTLPSDQFVVINIHPMHFALNTPHFDYMVEVKRRFTRDGWIGMSSSELDRYRYRGEGIRGVIHQLLESSVATGPLFRSIAKSPRFSTMIAEGNVSSARQRSKSLLGY